MIFLPDHAVAFGWFAAVFHDVPDFRHFSAKTNRNISIEAANYIDQEPVEFDAFLRRVA